MFTSLNIHWAIRGKPLGHSWKNKGKNGGKRAQNGPFMEICWPFMESH
jgi:hypothetical protein